MEGLLSVSVGTVFWASIAFIAVLLILKKMAWGPILQSLEEREQGIANALAQAEKAREEMAALKSGNDQLLKEAREERDRILKEAKEIGDKMRSDAKERAQIEGAQLIANAQREIENQKKAAIEELKNQVASLSIEIAEKLVREKLTDNEKQSALNSKLIQDLKVN
jgi:F-type H+-transporting ATPase subunit b